MARCGGPPARSSGSIDHDEAAPALRTATLADVAAPGRLIPASGVRRYRALGDAPIEQVSHPLRAGLTIASVAMRRSPTGG